MDRSRQLLLQLHRAQLLQRVPDLDSSAPMARVLTREMFVTTKMIVEMVLMKPTVVCNKQAIVKSAYTCIRVADAITVRLNSAQVLTMANSGVICNRQSPCIFVMPVWHIKAFNMVVKQVYQCYSHYTNATTDAMN